VFMKKTIQTAYTIAIAGGLPEADGAETIQ
jgi:hypothetical protein